MDFGDTVPELVGGVRRTRTNTENVVTGVKGELALPLIGDKQFMPTARVMGLAGGRDVQGEFGVGYDLADQQGLVGLGAQGPYANGGINLNFDGTVDPYLGLNSLGKAKDRKVIEGEAPPPP
jgi:hypothetical protein